MPADSISPIPRRRGPAIALEKADHWRTQSWGRGAKATAHRIRQSDLIGQGEFGAAQDMDIQEIQSKFGAKYDDAIKQMIEYTKRAGYRK